MSNSEALNEQKGRLVLISQYYRMPCRISGYLGGHVLCCSRSCRSMLTYMRWHTSQ